LGVFGLLGVRAHLIGDLDLLEQEALRIDVLDVVGVDGFDAEPRVRLLCARCNTALRTSAACKEFSRSVFILAGVIPLLGALHSDLRKTN
jgi:hypothetical protein